MTKIFAIREEDEGGYGEGYVSFHRTRAGAEAAIAKMAKERKEEGENNEIKKEGDNTLFYEEGFLMGWWWVKEETLED